jgi:hypothetical protein
MHALPHLLAQQRMQDRIVEAERARLVRQLPRRHQHR